MKVSLHAQLGDVFANNFFITGHDKNKARVCAVGQWSGGVLVSQFLSFLPLKLVVVLIPVTYSVLTFYGAILRRWMPFSDIRN